MTRNFRISAGFLLGTLFPLICFTGYAKYRFPDVGLVEMFGHVKSLGLTSAMLSLCVFTNLAIFFFFLWRGKDEISRGILIATFLYAILVAILKLSG